jgi:hypothetical protein
MTGHATAYRRGIAPVQTGACHIIGEGVVHD